MRRVLCCANSVVVSSNGCECKILSDSFSFVCVQNAIALVKGIPLWSLTPDNATPMRKYAMQQIMAEAVPTSRGREICDLASCSEPGRRDKWISCCCVCYQWCHFKYANIERVPENGFACVVCHAQYE
jgi:hypothetical protein